MKKQIDAICHIIITGVAAYTKTTKYIKIKSFSEPGIFQRHFKHSPFAPLKAAALSRSSIPTSWNKSSTASAAIAATSKDKASFSCSCLATWCQNHPRIGHPACFISLVPTWLWINAWI